MDMRLPSEDVIQRFKEEGHSAFIVGHTGETGKQLTKELLERKIFSRLVLIGRRQVNYDDPLYNDAEQVVVDFENLENSADAFKNIRTGFCCLGTTAGKSGKDGFYKVDHDYVMSVGKVARAAGCQDFHLVSSDGANKNSCLLYTRTKGEVESELKDLGFQRLCMYHPKLLMVDREEYRCFERILVCCFKPCLCCCPTAITTPVTTLATAMTNTATIQLESEIKSYTLDNSDIFRVAG